MKKESVPRWTRRIEDSSVRVVCIGLLFFAVLCALCIVIIVFDALLTGAWRILIGAEGVKGLQMFWLPYAPLLKVFFYSMTLFVASHTLMKYIDVETCRSLGEIRNKLHDDPKKKIHNYLMDEKDKKEEIIEKLKSFSNDGTDLSNVEIFDYLGTLELGAIMLTRGILSEKEFYNQFGYRFENLANAPELLAHIEQQHEYYEPLRFAMEVTKKYASK